MWNCMTEWISVKERLPEEGSTFLVYVDEEIYTAHFLRGIKENGIIGGWESCCYCGGESRVSFIDNKERGVKPIEWWQLMPQGPQKEE